MPIITISRWCCSKGHEIAEQVAAKLSYQCLSREVLLAASEEFNIPEIKLERALHDPVSVLDRITHGRERYVAFIRQAFLEKVQEDNVVYDGLAGHFLIEGIDHVLKVRIIADFEDRIRLEMERDHISRKEAIELLKRDDKERSRWSSQLYGLSSDEADLYDLVIHLRKIGVADAVDVICHTIQLPQFQASEEGRKKLDNLVVAARVKSALIEDWPEAKVEADDFEVVVEVGAAEWRSLERILDYEPKVTRAIIRRIEPLVAGRGIRVNVRPVL